MIIGKQVVHHLECKLKKQKTTDHDDYTKKDVVANIFSLYVSYVL